MKKITQQPVRKVYGPSNIQQDNIQLNAVRKINSLLSSGAVSVTGPIQPRILKQKVDATTGQTSAFQQLKQQQKCYICDDNCNLSSAIYLTAAATATSKTKLPNKIGRIVGDAFMVIVCEDDIICTKCMSLFNQLDRFENDVERIKNNILNSIYKKYEINDDNNTSTTTNTKTVQPIPNKFQKVNNTQTVFQNRIISSSNQSDDSTEELLTRKIPINNTVKQNIVVARTTLSGNADSIENQLSSLFESGNERQQVVQHQQPQQTLVKRGPIKIYKCMACEFKTTDMKLFQNHYEQCKPVTSQTTTTHQQVVQTGFRCKICKKLFASMQALKQHNVEKHSSTTILMEQTKLADDSSKMDRLMTQYACTLCKFETTDKRQYDEHLKKHGKLKPFKCRICSGRFETREQASIHAKTHQPEYFKCGSCSASFPQRELLMKHFETHEKQIKQQTTQKLLQETIDEALRVDSHENVESTAEKPISFFTCDLCAVTFLQEVYYNQHMESKHKTLISTNQQPTTQSQTLNTQQRQQNVQATIVNQTTNQQQSSSQSISDADLESIFEKMHSDKNEIDVNAQNVTKADTGVSNVVITSQESGGITFNITIPQGTDLNLNQDQKMNDDNSQEVQQPVMSIDMPVLEAMEDNSGIHHDQEMKLDDSNNQQMVGVPVSMPSLDDDVESQNSQHVNAEQGEDGQIKFILNDGQLLQLNNHILTDADGNSILVQGTDSEQIQQLLQSVGVLQAGDSLDGGLQMINENNQIMIVQQDGSGEAQLIDASMINADGQIVIQQHDDDNSQSAGEDGGVQMTFTHGHNNIELHQQMQDDGSQENSQMENHQDQSAGSEDQQGKKDEDEMMEIQQNEMEAMQVQGGGNGDGGNSADSSHQGDDFETNQAISSEATSTTQ